MLYAYNFLPIITKPTRLTDYTKTLIDHIDTNAYSDQISSGILLYDISDHLPVSCIIKFYTKRINKRRIFRDYTILFKSTWDTVILGHQCTCFNQIP